MVSPSTSFRINGGEPLVVSVAELLVVRNIEPLFLCATFGTVAQSPQFLSGGFFIFDWCQFASVGFIFQDESDPKRAYISRIN